MPAKADVSMKARCTSCRAVYEPTKDQMDEAKSFGCLMSPCCMAPATVEKVTVKRRELYT